MRYIKTLILVFCSYLALTACAGAQLQVESAAQPTAVTHNTWTSGAPMPTSVGGSAAGVLKGQIYVIGGNHGSEIVANNQIYNPSTNTWSTGTALPTTISGASGAVVNGVLYVFGGTSDSKTATNAVWGYSARTRKWTAEASMPTARWGTAAVVENKIVYVIGGVASNSDYLATVESYDPTTNTWTEEAPTSVPKAQPAISVIGTALRGFTIVAADGASQPGIFSGDTEGYDATTNTWRTLSADPTSRVATCFGSIGQKFYDVGGEPNPGGDATNVNESYTLSTNTWKTTLAPIPEATMFPFSAVYKGKLYCIGGRATANGTEMDSVQIYQP